MAKTLLYWRSLPLSWRLMMLFWLS